MLQREFSSAELIKDNLHNALFIYTGEDEESDEDDDDNDDEETDEDEMEDNDDGDDNDDLQDEDVDDEGEVSAAFCCHQCVLSAHCCGVSYAG